MPTSTTPAARARPELATEFVPLARGIWHLAEYVTIPRPSAGTRVIVEFTQGRIEGDRFKATLTGAASASWLTIGPGAIGQHRRSMEGRCHRRRLL